MRCWGVIILIGSLVAGAWAQDGDLESARQAVLSAYGQRAIDVAQTDSEQDDIRLARELLRASASRSKSAIERFVLADQAAVIAMTPGMPKSMEVAREAVLVAHSIRAYPVPRKEQRLLEITTARLDRLQAEHAAREAFPPAARAAADAHLVYARAAAPAGEINDAAEALLEARRLVRQYALADFSDRLDDTSEMIEAARRRFRRLDQARYALVDAEEEGDAEAIKLAKIELAEVIMELDGDVSAAAEHLAGTGDPRETAAVTAAAFMEGQFVPPADMMAAVKTLTEWIGSLPDSSRQTAAETALGMCEVIAVDPTLGGSAELAAFQERLGQLADRAPADQLRQQLADAYGTMTGNLMLLGNRRARVTYDFQSAEQLSDWRIEQGTWDWAHEALVCRDGIGSHEDATVGLRYRFRADRPLSVSFRVIATRQIGVRLDFRGWGRGIQEGYRVVFGAGGDQRGLIRGARFSVFGRRVEDRGLRLSIELTKPGGHNL